MDTHRKLSAFAGNDWIEILIKEYEEEVKLEARWPTILLKSTGRRMIWSICAILSVNSKGVPGCACGLLERYLSRHVRSFLQVSRNTEEWVRYKYMVASRFYLLMVSCVQLAAKMSDLQAPLNAVTVRNTLMKEGIDHTTAEIVQMEFHVFAVLDYRIPLWTTLEIAEYLSVQMGMSEGPVIEAVGLIINLTEYYRDILEFFMKNWITRNRVPTAMDAANPNRVTLHNLHVCAGVVSATALYVRHQRRNVAVRLAKMLRVEPQYIKAISNTILYNIIPERSYIPILKKRRFI